MNDLSPALAKRMKMTATLRDCERAIERAVFAYAEAGDALRTIRDKKLYKDEHSSFEAYCKERWGWSRSYVHRQIEAAQVHNVLVERVESVAPGQQIEPPRTEKAARELTPLRKKPAQLEEAWVRVVETHGPDATAKQVREVLADVLPPKESQATESQEHTFDDAVLALRRLMEKGYEVAVLRKALDAIDPDGRRR